MAVFILAMLGLGACFVALATIVVLLTLEAIAFYGLWLVAAVVAVAAVVCGFVGLIFADSWQ